MNTSSHEFVTVHMRGLKGALLARAQGQHISLSVLVRRVIARELALVDPSVAPPVATGTQTAARPIVKLTIRVTRDEAEQLTEGARQAGLSQSAFLMGLLAQVPSLLDGGGSRLDCLAALTASNAELSALGRSVNHLAALLRQGEVQAAQEYRRMLDTLAGDVRAHLRLAASVLAALRPARQPAKSSQQRQTGIR
jgi:Tfp pilus assembly protein PilN